MRSIERSASKRVSRSGGWTSATSLARRGWATPKWRSNSPTMLSSTGGCCSATASSSASRREVRPLGSAAITSSSSSRFLILNSNRVTGNCGLHDVWYSDKQIKRARRSNGVNGNRKPHIYGNRKLHTSGEDVSGGADILPVMPVGRVGLDAGSGATGVLVKTRRDAAEPAVTLRLPHAVRPTLSSASADAPASGSCCPGC